MSKKFIVLSAIVASLPIAASAPAAKPAEVKAEQKPSSKATPNIRYMDLSVVMGNCKEGKEASARLEKLQADLAARVNKKGKAYEDAGKAYREQEKMLSADARNKKQQELVRLEAEYQNELKSCENEFKLVVQQETEKIAQHVDTAVSKMAKAEGLDAVVDKMSGRPVFTASTVDRTQDVIEAMNKEYKPAAAAAKA